MTPPNYTLFRHRAPVAIPLTACICVLVVGVLAWPYTVDDAFIAARYARNLARGVGYGMNPHATSDGITAPLWLVPQLAAVWLGLDPLATAKSLGLACAIAATWIALRRLRARSGGRAATIAAAALIACSPSLGTWAVAGLETGLATLLFTAAALCATRRARAAPLGLGASIAALAWLRPELAVACAVLLAYVAMRDRRAGTTAFALALGGAAGVLAFRFALFGDALPLSIRAKPASLDNGVRYVLMAVVLATSIAGAWLTWVGARRGQSAERVYGAALLAHVSAVAFAGGDWMPGYRLLVPILPIYAVLAGVGASRQLAHRPALFAGCIALACALPAADLVTRIPELRRNAQHRERLEPLARSLSSADGAVALIDVGYLGYTGDMPVVDLGGLTDPVIARMPGGHLSKRIDAAHLRARDPAVIVLHSATPPRIGSDGNLRAFGGYPVEQRVAAMPFVRARFRVREIVDYAPGYRYIVLARSASGPKR